LYLTPLTHLGENALNKTGIRIARRVKIPLRQQRVFIVVNILLTAAI